MRFPVKNCYSKVIVSESLEMFLKLLLLLLYSRIYLSYHIWQVTKFGRTNPFRIILDAVFLI